jgi:hypothetical protein
MHIEQLTSDLFLTRWFLLHWPGAEDAARFSEKVVECEGAADEFNTRSAKLWISAPSLLSSLTIARAAESVSISFTLESIRINFAIFSRKLGDQGELAIVLDAPWACRGRRARAIALAGRRK